MKELKRIGEILKGQFSPAEEIKYCRFYDTGKQRGIIITYCNRMKGAGLCRNNAQFCLSIYNKIIKKCKEILKNKAVAMGWTVSRDKSLIDQFKYAVEMNQIKECIENKETGVYQDVKDYDNGKREGV